MMTSTETQPPPKRIGPRWLRRTLVVVYYATAFGIWVALTIVQTGINVSAANGLLTAGLFGAAVLAVIWFVALRQLPREAVDLVGKQLDERLIVRRNITLARAFRLAWIACALAWLLWMLHDSAEAGWTVPFAGLLRSVSPSLIFPLLTYTVASLPLAILAWTEPDPVPDDEP
jgi:Na+/proline symporter